MSQDIVTKGLKFALELVKQELKFLPEEFEQANQSAQILSALTGGPKLNVTPDKENQTPEEQAHQSNKIVRQALAFVHFRMQVYAFRLNQSADALLSLQVLEKYCHDLQAAIEKVEPPKAKEETKAKGPMVMDLTHIGAKAEQVTQ